MGILALRVEVGTASWALGEAGSKANPGGSGLAAWVQRQGAGGQGPRPPQVQTDSDSPEGAVWRGLRGRTQPTGDQRNALDREGTQEVKAGSKHHVGGCHLPAGHRGPGWCPQPELVCHTSSPDATLLQRLFKV